MSSQSNNMKALLVLALVVLVLAGMVVNGVSAGRGGGFDAVLQQLTGGIQGNGKEARSSDDRELTIASTIEELRQLMASTTGDDALQRAVQRHVHAFDAYVNGRDPPRTAEDFSSSLHFQHVPHMDELATQARLRWAVAAEETPRTHDIHGVPLLVDQPRLLQGAITPTSHHFWHAVRALEEGDFSQNTLNSVRSDLGLLAKAAVAAATPRLNLHLLSAQVCVRNGSRFVSPFQTAASIGLDCTDIHSAPALSAPLDAACDANEPSCVQHSSQQPIADDTEGRLEVWLPLAASRLDITSNIIHLRDPRPASGLAFPPSFQLGNTRALEMQPGTVHIVPSSLAGYMLHKHGPVSGDGGGGGSDGDFGGSQDDSGGDDDGDPPNIILVAHAVKGGCAGGCAEAGDLSTCGDGCGGGGNDDTLTVELHSAWAGVNGRGHFNAPHNHPDATLSGVVYLRTGHASPAATTRITFIKPNCHSSNSSRCHVSADVEAGDVLVFPSWLDHFVPPHTGAEPRMMVAFNARVRYTYANGGEGAAMAGNRDASVHLPRRHMHAHN
ncbi:hypothetical protein PTSG_08240 [Salpingoeca rosetta]|uniref:Cupin-like domain-containing protein n=1 Tax=Salpingoeca rosetta (strain ATCC 50818 / BSB-021) TaxID=946362 RepID=F2UIE6_SALR5|nr:uncharacterized protein PTSG_08240 [Salpingoeca rosetta]EGD76895.1 hypothetical protein PTSG_08240 [Salpingoeca rosetta]|eukprot:XP_004991266.1 hypothetical protein PTSG_08240 [Salpingoeca rosetta]